MEIWACLLLTFSLSNSHEGSDEARLFAHHGHDLNPGFNAVHGVDHQPEARPPKTATEHGRSHTFNRKYYWGIPALSWSFNPQTFLKATSVFERERFSLCTYVVFATLHVICERRAPQLVGTEEAEVARHLPGDGGDQPLEESHRPLVPHDGFHHRPHGASDAEQKHGRSHKNNNTPEQICPRLMSTFYLMSFFSTRKYFLHVLKPDQCKPHERMFCS